MESFDLICVGSGFASHFFLWKWLRLAPPNQRALLLERGPELSHPEHRERRGAPPGDPGYVNETPGKAWEFRSALGGCSNCWTGNTPRMLPSDFELRTRYGIGEDWPLGYGDLERFYCEAEQIMGVSGPERSPFPRSRPYPLPAHRGNAFDRALAKAWPEQMFALPCARPSRPIDGRPRCCASGVCRLCPIDAKFTILNGMRPVTRHARVELRTGHEVSALELEAGRAVAVRGRAGEREFAFRGDLIVLGANAIFNAAILLRSGLTHPELGRGITEQVSVYATAHTRGLENFDGSTVQTGHGYMCHDGPQRSERAAALLETGNNPWLRNEPGRWRDVGHFKLIFEDLRRPDNRVYLDSQGVAHVAFHGHSEHAQRGIAAADQEIERVLTPLSVDRMLNHGVPGTESHIMCSTPMGRSPQSSIVDRELRHHTLRNLIVAGSSVFPTAPPANPTLTLSALSLWAAERALAP